MMMERDRTAMMARIKDEGRWIRRNLIRTFMVCEKVVLWDDGSTDNTETEALASMEQDSKTLNYVQDRPFGWVAYNDGNEKTGRCELHYLKSPFAQAVRPKERVSEIRDKNVLWYYMKNAIDFDNVLCLDGDEMLSMGFIREWPTICAFLQTHDILSFPFIYLWDQENKRRVDGVYRRIDHSRLFTTRRLSEQNLFDSRFAWEGTKGGFHCGSIPRESFIPQPELRGGTVSEAPIIHFGYLTDEMRQRKLIFYQGIDPDNKTEGYYTHIVGIPNHLAPGPLELVDYEDV